MEEKLNDETWHHVSDAITESEEKARLRQLSKVKADWEEFTPPLAGFHLHACKYCYLEYECSIYDKCFYPNDYPCFDCRRDELKMSEFRR